MYLKCIFHVHWYAHCDIYESGNDHVFSCISVNLDFPDPQVKTRPSTREVVAIHTLEEVCIEVVITLPQNYPLGNITVSSEKKVGVTSQQWDKWLLQLNIFLQHQVTITGSVQNSQSFSMGLQETMPTQYVVVLITSPLNLWWCRSNGLTLILNTSCCWPRYNTYTQ